VSSPSDRIRVWDLPTRIFHWALAVLVVFSFTTGKVGGGWMEWHLKSGYAILALLIFRLAWGAVGSQTARFASFVRGPRAAWAHARELLASRYVALPGHNPLGGWMVVVLIAMLLLQTTSGLFADDEIATQGPLAVMVSNALVSRLSAIHAYNSWAIAGAVAVHVLAIVLYRWRFKADLTSPMLHGWTAVPPGTRRADLSQASPALALIALACAAAFVYWLVAIFPKGA
jgi:cytochrome b